MRVFPVCYEKPLLVEDDAKRLDHYTYKNV